MSVKSFALFMFVMIVGLFSQPHLSQAHEFSIGDLRIEHPWSRPAISGRPNAGYFVIDNNGKTDDRLIDVRSSAFAKALLHESTTDGDVMKMQHVDAVVIPAGQSVSFAPGGYHVMLMEPKEPFAEGATFPMTLIFEKAGAVDVVVNVERHHDTGDDHSGHGHSH